MTANITSSNKGYLISTNADGCVTGDYCAELITDYDEAIKILAFVRRGDPDAKLMKVIEESEV